MKSVVLAGALMAAAPSRVVSKWMILMFWASIDGDAKVRAIRCADGVGAADAFLRRG
jgi:hypothetical protein